MTVWQNSRAAKEPALVYFDDPLAAGCFNVGNDTVPNFDLPGRAPVRVDGRLELVQLVLWAGISQVGHTNRLQYYTTIIRRSDSESFYCPSPKFVAAILNS